MYDSSMLFTSTNYSIHSIHPDNSIVTDSIKRQIWLWQAFPKAVY